MSPFPLLSNPSKPKITRLISFSGLNIISHRVPKKRDTTSAICSSLVGDGGNIWLCDYKLFESASL